MGNLADISKRALCVLADAECILAEDTSRSIKLLSAFGINTPLKRYDAAQEKRLNQNAQLRAFMRRDASIALISDAGSPLISDPGALIVELAHKMKKQVIPIPGPCAAIAALSVSGFQTQSFFFGGYLPRVKAARCAILEKYRSSPDAIVFYEVPHRIQKSWVDVQAILGNERKAVLARELTKVYETVLRGTVAEISQAVHGAQPKGEMVLVLEGNKEEKPQWEEEDERVLKLLLTAMPRRQAATLAAKVRRKKRNLFYRHVLAMKT